MQQWAAELTTIPAVFLMCTVLYQLSYRLLTPRSLLWYLSLDLFLYRCLYLCWYPPVITCSHVCRSSPCCHFLSFPYFAIRLFLTFPCILFLFFFYQLGPTVPSVGVQLAFEVAGIPLPPLAYYCNNGIPYGSGLGSSSAAIVSGIMAGLVLAGKELQVEGQEELLQLAARVEGHIDNLSPCIYGGIQVRKAVSRGARAANGQTPAAFYSIICGRRAQAR